MALFLKKAVHLINLKEEGRRKKEEGRGKREEGRRKKEEGEEIMNHKGTETQRKKKTSPSPHPPHREHFKFAKKTVVGASRSLGI